MSEIAAATLLAGLQQLFKFPILSVSIHESVHLCLHFEWFFNYELSPASSCYVGGLTQAVVGDDIHNARRYNNSNRLPTTGDRWHSYSSADADHLPLSHGQRAVQCRTAVARRLRRR